MPSERFVAVVPSAEHQLLLLLSRTRPTQPVYAEAQRLIRETVLDWELFIEVAANHGVLSLCHRHLVSLRSGTLPAELNKHIQASVMASAMHNLEMTKEVTRLTMALTEAHIDILTYKGPSLSILAYGEVGARQFSDLDLLVSAQHLLEAKSIILDQGYYAVSSPEHRDMQKEDHDRSYQGYDLVRNDGRVVVDLQERFGLRFSSFKLGFEELWSRRQKMQFGDRTVSTPSLEDYLLILCAHGTQHRWNRLKWVCDIAQLVQASPTLNWQVVMDRAALMKIERMVYIGLLLAHEALDMPLPDTIRDRVFADHPSVSLAHQVIKWMFISTSGASMLIQRAQLDYGFDLSVRSSLSEKISCVLYLTRRRLFPRRNHS